MWPFKKPKLIELTRAQQEAIASVVLAHLPISPKINTAILTLTEVLTLLPTLATHFSGEISPNVIAKFYDTLLNSVVVPPKPWPDAHYKFSHMLTFPTSNQRHVTYFVFHPL